MSTDWGLIGQYVMALFVIPVIILAISYYKYQQSKPTNSRPSIHKIKRPLKYTSAQANGALLKYFPYYQDLDKAHRPFFLKRVEEFMQIKEFIPRQTEPNETINVLIAATAVQMTFGMEDFSLYTFSKILIYPDTYFSEIRKTHHKGEINVRLKLIVLSAKHFLSGVRDPDDGINLGLHEMAHALNVHTFEGFNQFLIDRFVEWSDVAILEMGNIDTNANHFLRKYAGTNIEEMFAVCTENFFERPEKFSTELPVLYSKMMNLFKQDPRVHNNPSLRVSH